MSALGFDPKNIGSIPVPLVESKIYAVDLQLAWRAVLKTVALEGAIGSIPIGGVDIVDKW